jgi:type I restriction enzyme, S subunit
MSWQIVPMSSFLKARTERFKPKDNAIKGLKRIEKIDFSGNIYISDKPSNTDMILVKKGDFVISGINVEKGAMAIYQGDSDITATIHYSSYIYNEEKIDLKFLKSFLKSPEFIEAIKEQVPGGIKTEIKPKHILPLKISIPTDLKEQKQIVKKLESANSFINAQSSELSQQIDFVKQLRQAFLREAMQGKLTAKWRKDNVDVEPASELLKKIKAEKEKLVKEGQLKKNKPLPAIKEDEIPFEIPESWVWCRLGDITLYSEAGKSLKAQDLPAEKGQWGVIKTSSITSGIFNECENKSFLNFTNNYKNLLIQKGDILFCRASGSKELTGTSCIVREHPISNLILSDKSIRYHFSKLISKEFIQQYNLSQFSRNYYENLGTKKSTSMNNVTREQFNSLLIPLLPFLEQQQIVTKLDELMQYCEKLEDSIKTSRQQNEMLLQQVLREALEPKVEQILD